MASRKLFVTLEDFDLLLELLKEELLGAISDPKAARDLATELQHATIVDSASVPDDVVTMNSTVKLTDLETKRTETYTLVYPDDVNITVGRLSILAPIGTAILGNQVGHTVGGSDSADKSILRIDEVIYQPERDSVAA
ncbi:Regulator of nucleoside diphosphate kinase [Stieleria maiorica]|uniref:Regulator of nucleoside diphosphate kinase n=1 Tax=Stieleria maiorica TaxID=2795974 RepID=A0A5B9MCX7_9BACT|nr:GreA/GreB family elongation factor [Stieleria maiorica]QEF97800.1 Regulator of nucleoside diphosphate kinase [Stieleria maiorica]